MSRHLYHYHATWQSMPGNIVHVDGLAQTDRKITSYEDYQELKQRIADGNDVHPNKITLRSLTYLGQESLTATGQDAMGQGPSRETPACPVPSTQPLPQIQAPEEMLAQLLPGESVEWQVEDLTAGEPSEFRRCRECGTLTFIPNGQLLRAGVMHRCSQGHPIFRVLPFAVRKRPLVLPEGHD